MTATEQQNKSIEKHALRLLERKIAAVQHDKERLDRLEKNIKHLAKELGIELT